MGQHFCIWNFWLSRAFLNIILSLSVTVWLTENYTISVKLHKTEKNAITRLFFRKFTEMFVVTKNISINKIVFDKTTLPIKYLHIRDGAFLFVWELLGITTWYNLEKNDDTNSLRVQQSWKNWKQREQKNQNRFDLYSPFHWRGQRERETLNANYTTKRNIYPFFLLPLRIKDKDILYIQKTNNWYIQFNITAITIRRIKRFYTYKNPQLIHTL